jgi:hypothetical protein
VGWLAIGGMALSSLFFVTDLLEASAGRTAAGALARRADFQTEGTFWYLSWWGFGYYADHEGMRPLQLNRELPRPGDLLAVQDIGGLREALAHHPEVGLELIDTVVVGDGFPLQVLPGYYAGQTPLENHRGGRIRVLVYRITSAIPQTAASEESGDRAVAAGKELSASSASSLRK